MASCGGAHLGYEDADLKHGVFTSCLLDGLLGEAADPAGLITVPGLYDYISRRMTDFKLQTPIFRGDIAGQLVLGQGLDPRRDPLRDSDRAIVIEREARKHLQNYQKLVAPAFADLNAWKTEGHKSACQALEPILGWFEGRIRAYPNLKNRPVFMEQHNAAMGRLASLCTLEAELVTIDGIVTDKLGSGNFGTVWNIKRPGAVPPLAYKVYHYQDLDVGEKLKRFRRGYDAMAQLDHPHIIKVHRFTKCPVGFYMTFIDGPNLRDFTGTLEDPCSLLKCLLTIAETLKHAHKRGVVHRDVKPENILMKYEKSVWLPFLTDFDLAWFSTATQVTKEARGTWQYSAPEQLATPTSASAHAKTTDSYSFGQLCYFALTGSDPVPLDMADNRGRLAEKLHLGWFVEAAEEFVDLYVSCTERNPKKRPLFGDICETLFKVYGLLSDIATSDVLSVDRFVKELVFSMAGLSSDRKGDDDSFTTLTGKTRVLVSPDRQKHRTIGLVYDFHALVPPYLGGTDSYEKMRKVLGERIDRVLDEIPNTRRQAGSQAPFQVFVYHRDVPWSLEGLRVSRVLISGVVDAIEGM